MNPAALALAQLIILYGIPAALKIWEIINKPSITAEDITELKNIQPPSAYITLPTG